MTAPRCCIALAALSLLSLLSLLSGCQQTTLLIDLQLAAGLAQPSALRLSLFHGGLLSRASVPTDGHSLPGTLLVQKIPSGPGLRLQMDGLDTAGDLISQAAQSINPLAGSENRLTLTLTTPLPDSDGDGVPDVIDDCPAEPDPDQKCPDRAHDMAGDLAPHDLASKSDSAVAPIVCPSDALLCDDFETGDTSKWNSGIEAPSGTLGVKVDGVLPRSGKFSLHATASKSDLSGSWFRTLDENFNMLQPPFALRVWIQTTQPLNNYTLAAAFYSGDLTLSVGGDDDALFVVDEDFTSNTLDHSTTTAVPVGRWVCVELVHDGTMIHLYTDSVERVAFTPSITTPYDSMSLGLVRWPANHDAEIFFDDVVVAKSQVGCQ